MGPACFQLNLSLSKNFQFTERYGLELRCDTFNFTNTPEFATRQADQNSITSSSYGVITSTLGSGTGVNGTGGGRAIQLAAKFSF